MSLRLFFKKFCFIKTTVFAKTKLIWVWANPARLSFVKIKVIKCQTASDFFTKKRVKKFNFAICATMFAQSLLRKLLRVQPRQKKTSHAPCEENRCRNKLRLLYFFRPLYHSHPAILSTAVTINSTTAAKYFPDAIKFPPIVDEITDGILAIIDIAVNSA